MKLVQASVVNLVVLILTMFRCYHTQSKLTLVEIKVRDAEYIQNTHNLEDFCYQPKGRLLWIFCLSLNGVIPSLGEFWSDFSLLENFRKDNTNETNCQMLKITGKKKRKKWTNKNKTCKILHILGLQIGEDMSLLVLVLKYRRWGYFSSEIKWC